jgi:hypothetical protein
MVFRGPQEFRTLLQASARFFFNWRTYNNFENSAKVPRFAVLSRTPAVGVGTKLGHEVRIVLVFTLDIPASATNLNMNRVPCCARTS